MDNENVLFGVQPSSVDILNKDDSKNFEKRHKEKSVTQTTIASRRLVLDTIKPILSKIFTNQQNDKQQMARAIHSPQKFRQLLLEEADGNISLGLLAVFQSYPRSSIYEVLEDISKKHPEELSKYLEGLKREVQTSLREIWQHNYQAEKRTSDEVKALVSSTEPYTNIFSTALEYLQLPPLPAVSQREAVTYLTGGSVLGLGSLLAVLLGQRLSASSEEEETSFRRKTSSVSKDGSFRRKGINRRSDFIGRTTPKGKRVRSNHRHRSKYGSRFTGTKRDPIFDETLYSAADNDIFPDIYSRDNVPKKNRVFVAPRYRRNRHTTYRPETVSPFTQGYSSADYVTHYSDTENLHTYDRQRENEDIFPKEGFYYEGKWYKNEADLKRNFPGINYAEKDFGFSSHKKEPPKQSFEVISLVNEDFGPHSVLDRSSFGTDFHRPSHTGPLTGNYDEVYQTGARYAHRAGMDDHLPGMNDQRHGVGFDAHPSMSAPHLFTAQPTWEEPQTHRTVVEEQHEPVPSYDPPHESHFASYSDQQETRNHQKKASSAAESKLDKLLLRYLKYKNQKFALSDDTLGFDDFGFSARMGFPSTAERGGVTPVRASPTTPAFSRPTSKYSRHLTRW